jgi:hypothetical protein
VTDVAVETIKARGEPAGHDRLLGEILVGLDRAGQLRRLAGAEEGEADSGDEPTAERGTSERDPVSLDHSGAPGSPADAHDAPDGADQRPAPDIRHARTAEQSGSDAPSGPNRSRRSTRSSEPSTDQVERLLALIRDELSRPGQKRLTEIEPGRWWLADAADRAGAAVPLADRVEWAVFSLLSTAGALPESAFFERIAALFTGHDLPDEALVRACLQSYRSLASTPDRVLTGDDLLRRAQGLGMSVWIGRREQARKLGGRRLADWIDEREHRVYLAQISRAVDEVAEVDCIWYVRGRAAFLFEVEWTAMLGEPILRRHARIPSEESLVRFLVIAPERTELVRHKIERSPLIREAMEQGNWHILKWNHLRAFLARDPLDLADLEPFLGLDPVLERSGEQLPLFEGGGRD